MRLANFGAEVGDDDYRLIGIPFQSQLVREHRLLHNRTYLQSSQSRLIVLIVAELVLALNCIIGDYFIFRSMTIIDLVRSHIGLSERLVRALMDSASHFFVAFASWFIATYATTSSSSQVNSSSSTLFSIKDVFIVGLMAMFIDIDHFLEARSTSLLQAISLPKRPFLHNRYIIPQELIYDTNCQIHINMLIRYYIWISRNGLGVRVLTNNDISFTPQKNCIWVKPFFCGKKRFFFGDLVYTRFLWGIYLYAYILN